MKKWKIAKRAIVGIGIFLMFFGVIAVKYPVVTVVFKSQDKVFEYLRDNGYFMNPASATEITALSGDTGKVGTEDNSWGTGETTDTFTITGYSGGAVTLTKVPSLFANIESIIKGKWYVTTSATVLDHGDSTASGSIAWVIATLAGSPAVIELPPATYTIGTATTFPATVTPIFQPGAQIVANANVTISGNSIYQGGSTPALSSSAGKTVTFGSISIEAGRFQIFTGAGNFSFASGTKLYSAWFGGFVNAISKISTALVELEITESATVTTNTTVNANTTLRWNSPGKVVTVTTGDILTVNGKVEAGPYPIFAPADTTGVVFGSASTPLVYVEWMGAAADGDATTDDGPAILTALLAAANGTTVKFGFDAGYYNAGTELALGDTRILTVEGPATIYYGGAANCFAVRSGVATSRNHHTIRDLVILASAGNERIGANQVGIYIEDSCKNTFQNILVSDLYVGIKQVNVALYSEVNKFSHVTSREGLYCWYFDGVVGSRSMATTDFDQISATTTQVGGICFYVGADTSLYRSRFQAAFFPRAVNAIGVYWDGLGKGITGSIGVEGTVGPPAGSVGWYFGANAGDCNWDIASNIIAVATDVDFDPASSVTPSPGLFATTFGRTQMVMNAKAANVSSVLDEDGTTYYLKQYLTAAGKFQWQTDGTNLAGFRIIGDTSYYSPIEITPVTLTATATDGDTTPSVKGLGGLRLSNTAATTVTRFDDGISGQTIIVRHTNANTTINQTGNIELTYDAAVSFTGAANQMQVFRYDGTAAKWYEISRTTGS